MSYFISQEEDTGWRVDADELLRKLRERWPDAVIRPIPEPRKYSHEWSVPVEDGAVEGMIHRDGTSLVMDGSPEAIAAFAAWYQRDVLESDRQLVLYDQEYLRVVPLKPGVEPGAIAAVLRS